MALIGYARVSSADQSLDIQIEKLQEAGCVRIFSEKLSGTKSENRPALQDCLRYVREGDVFMVTRLDRMARSMGDFFKILEDLQSRDIQLKCLLQPEIDTTTTNGRLVTGVLAVIAQFETEIRRERQAEGIARAKAKGVYNKNAVRQGKLAQASYMLHKGLTYAQVARKLQLPDITLRRHFPDYAKQTKAVTTPIIDPRVLEAAYQVGYDTPTTPSAAKAVEPEPTPETPPAKASLLGKILGR